MTRVASSKLTETIRRWPEPNGVIQYDLDCAAACLTPGEVAAQRAKVTHKFGDLSDIQKCAFILGCTVSCGVTEISANPVEDLANRKLVGDLWENRCAALEADATLDLTDTENVRRGRPKRGVRGVEAHGNATLSN